jgi:hypothetical protein
MNNRELPVLIATVDINGYTAVWQSSSIILVFIHLKMMKDDWRFLLKKRVIGKRAPTLPIVRQNRAGCVN